MEFFAAQAINGIVLGVVLALFALGFSLVLADLRVFNVAHFGVFAWGAIVSYLVITDLHAPFWLALVASVVTGAGGSALVYVTMVRHLLRSPGREMSAFISTLGGMIALTECGNLVLGGGNTVGLPYGAVPLYVWKIGGLITISTIEILMIGLAVLSLLALWLLMERSQLGRTIKTVAFDRELAGLLGINADVVTVVVFSLSGAMAGLAAALIGAAFNAISADMGTTYGLLAIAITVLGGFGSLPGAMVASVVVGLVSSLTTAYISSSYQDAIVFGLVLVGLLVRPTGLFTVRREGRV